MNGTAKICLYILGTAMSASAIKTLVAKVLPHSIVVRFWVSLSEQLLRRELCAGLWETFTLRKRYTLRNYQRMTELYAFSNENRFQIDTLIGWPFKWTKFSGIVGLFGLKETSSIVSLERTGLISAHDSTVNCRGTIATEQRKDPRNAAQKCVQSQRENHLFLKM